MTEESLKKMQYKYKKSYYEEEVYKCKEELKDLKASMRNVGYDELRVKKMSQDILKNRIDYYTVLIKLLEAEYNIESSIQDVALEQSVSISDEKIEKRGWFVDILDKYYVRLIKRISVPKVKI